MGPSTPTVSVRDPFMSEARERVSGRRRRGKRWAGESGDALAVARGDEGAVSNNRGAESEIFSHTQHAHALTFARRDLRESANEEVTREGQSHKRRRALRLGGGRDAEMRGAAGTTEIWTADWNDGPVIG